MSDQDNDPYFGYDINALQNASAGHPASPLFDPNYTSQYSGHAPALPTFYSDAQKVDDREDPDLSTRSWDFSGKDIGTIHLWIKGEQPGTTEERAQQWGNISLMLQGVADQLREQTQDLIKDWESPKAKQVFLHNVGMTLGYLEVWKQAAIENEVALYGLAQVMREAQADMDQLYTEYAFVHAGMQYASDKLVTNPYGGVNVAAGMDRKDRENQEEYNKKARALANKYASEYAPYLTKLNTGHAKMVEKLNAVAHPGAFGQPTPPMPGLPPGGPPPSPPPGAPPPAPPPGAPPAPPPGAPPAPPPGAPPAPPPGAPPAPPPGAPPAPPPGAPPPTVPAPSAPAPTPPGLTGLPNLVPSLFNARNTAPTPFAGKGPGLFSTNTPTGVPPTLGNLSPETALGAGNGAPNLSSNSLYPPGTITPPPGVTPPPGAQSAQAASKQDKRLQDNAGSPGLGSVPPGSLGGLGPRQAQQGTSASSTVAPEVAQGFQPPPSSAPSVLDNARKRGQSVAGSAAEAPVTPPGGLGAPPVLSNPHRTGPAKTFSERIAEGRRALRRKRGKRSESEFAAGLPTGTAPMLEGRFAERDKVTVGPAGEIPAALRTSGLEVSTSDPHARPAVHADRTARSPLPATPVPGEKAPVTDESAFEVQTPGGPVVAGGQGEQRYHANPPSALGGGN
ncbi:hypothetical protein [Amycolatopsis taiwanensis]|uniref:PPE family domain-containing protein n=1 Tax=Amycolatopsis taiwanensis TaxID=342230 RepID=A0A9W6QVI6_9PSEU|nr:hypothetical protein [Amycolatopsis taiwanensis]GLY64811.1 hypothetical protein Atai01_14300 [Amycolatopsis taiwanensis]